MLEDQYKIHETEEDRERERIALETFTKAKGYTAQQVSKLKPFDAKIYNSSGKLIALAEVKCRKNLKNQYPTLRIDKAKIDAMMALCRKNNLKAALIVSWRGKVWWTNLSQIEAQNSPGAPLFESGVMQRLDRDELADEVYDIPTNLFAPVLQD